MRLAHVIPPTLFWTTTDTYIYIYISREISIEHPSVGLTSLAQFKKLNIYQSQCSGGLVAIADIGSLVKLEQGENLVCGMKTFLKQP